MILMTFLVLLFVALAFVMMPTRAPAVTCGGGGWSAKASLTFTSVLYKAYCSSESHAAPGVAVCLCPVKAVPGALRR